MVALRLEAPLLGARVREASASFRVDDLCGAQAAKRSQCVCAAQRVNAMSSPLLHPPLSLSPRHLSPTPTSTPTSTFYPRAPIHLLPYSSHVQSQPLVWTAVSSYDQATPTSSAAMATTQGPTTQRPSIAAMTHRVCRDAARMRAGHPIGARAQIRTVRDQQLPTLGLGTVPFHSS